MLRTMLQKPLTGVDSKHLCRALQPIFHSSHRELVRCSRIQALNAKLCASIGKHLYRGISASHLAVGDQVIILLAVGVWTPAKSEECGSHRLVHNCHICRASRNWKLSFSKHPMKSWGFSIFPFTCYGNLSIQRKTYEEMTGMQVCCIQMCRKK